LTTALLIPREHFSKLESEFNRYRDLTSFESVWILDKSDGGDEISLFAEEIIDVADFEGLRAHVRQRHHLPGHNTVREINIGNRWHKNYTAIGILDRPRPRQKYRYPLGNGLIVQAKRYGQIKVESMSSSFSTAWRKMKESKQPRYALDDDFYFERTDMKSSRSEATLFYKPGKARQTADRLNRLAAAEDQIQSGFFLGKNSYRQKPIDSFATLVSQSNNTMFSFEHGNLEGLIGFLYILEKTGTAETNPFWRSICGFDEFIREMRPAIFWLHEYRLTSLHQGPAKGYACSNWRRWAYLLWFERWLTREYLWWREDSLKRISGTAMTKFLIYGRIESRNAWKLLKVVFDEGLAEQEASELILQGTTNYTLIRKANSERDIKETLPAYLNK